MLAVISTVKYKDMRLNILLNADRKTNRHRYTSSVQDLSLFSDVLRVRKTFFAYIL
jgi:hypothetical protein